MSEPPKPAALTRQQLIDESNRLARLDLAKRAARQTPAGDADVRAQYAAQAETAAVAASRRSAPIATKLPLATRIATAEPDRMINMPVCEADLAKYQGRPFDKKAWIALLEKAADTEAFGNVHPSTVILAGNQLADAAEDGRGMVRWTYNQWAAFLHCCRSTVHKIVRGLWETELARIANPFYWVGREQRRAANAYFPTMPAAVAGVVAESLAIPEPPASSELAPVAEAEAPAGAVKALQRMAAAVKELLPHFPGLHARVLGLNTSPLRAQLDPQGAAGGQPAKPPRARLTHDNRASPDTRQPGDEPRALGDLDNQIATGYATQRRFVTPSASGVSTLRS